MRVLFYCFCLLWSLSTAAQTEEPIVEVAEQMPMFPGCEDSTGTYLQLKSCADKKMLQFIYANVKYPEVDRLKGNEGTVVLRFVVEKDGTISDPSIIRDPGDQLGEEALRVVNIMNQLPDRWTPGKMGGELVRSYFTLPIRFKIQEVEEPDFVISGRDSIWVKFNTPVLYTAGEDALQAYLEKNLKMPREGQDSCRIGEIEINILVYQDGSLKIIDMIDYSALGFDYQFEAIRAINATSGQWTPATLGNRNINTTRSLRVRFQPNYLTCGNTISNFERANDLVNEATVLIEQDSAYQAGITKLSEAIELFPNNAEFLSIRGQAFLQMDRKAEACLDLQRTTEVIPGSWYSSLLPIICRETEEEAAPAPEQN